MKLQYFHQPAADQDDRVLEAQIARKVVPATCLLGGQVVAHWSEQGVDPCTQCACPARGRCGGRPQTTSHSAEMEPLPAEAAHIQGESGARKLRRLEHRRALLEACAAAEARKDRE